MDSIQNVSIPIKVQCYSGHKADERPKAFVLHDELYTIVEVERVWRQEDVRTGERKDLFKVRASDDRVYGISHNIRTDEWLLEPESANEEPRNS